MPVPTDQLADEIKDLTQRLDARLDSQEKEFREIRDDFSKEFREIRDDFSKEFREIRDDFSKEFREIRDESTKFREMFLVFRTRVNTILAIASTVVLLSAVTVVLGVLTYQYERGRMEAVIANQTGSMERLEKRFDELRPLGDRLDRLSEDIARLQGKLDRGATPVPKQ